MVDVDAAGWILNRADHRAESRRWGTQPIATDTLVFVPWLHITRIWTGHAAGGTTTGAAHGAVWGALAGVLALLQGKLPPLPRLEQNALAGAVVGATIGSVVGHDHGGWRWRLCRARAR